MHMYIYTQVYVYDTSIHPIHVSPHPYTKQDAVPLPALEGLPFLLAAYERAVLARWALASSAAAAAAVDDGNGALAPVAVLSALLDALGALGGGVGGWDGCVGDCLFCLCNPLIYKRIGWTIH